MQAQRGGADARISALADRQHRVVAVWQLRALGVTAGAIENRTRKARLHRVYQAVYAVGTPTLTPHGHLMAAVLAYGPDAVISHRSAAALHDLRPSDQVRIDVTVPRCGVRGRERVRVHCTHRLDPPTSRRSTASR